MKLKGPDQCENCLADGPTRRYTVRQWGLEDTLWLCKECGHWEKNDYDNEDEEEPDGTMY